MTLLSSAAENLRLKERLNKSETKCIALEQRLTQLEAENHVLRLKVEELTQDNTSPTW
jgi:cell division protein FtsB